VLKVALRPKWIGALVLALVLASLFAFLANWQFSRAHTRAQQSAGTPVTEIVKPFTDVAHPEQTLPSSDAYQMVSLTGHYNPDQQVVIPARKLGGRTGYWVVTMFVPDGANVTAVAQDGREIAIPAVRGWTDDESAAHASRASTAPVALTARIQPTESPTATDKMPAGEMATLSTAQLVNTWDVLSYAGYLLPTEQSGAGAAQATSGLTAVPAPPPKPQGLNLQSLFYSIEWVVFAVFAIYVWFRMMRDEYLREIEEAEMADRMVEFSPKEIDS